MRKAPPYFPFYPDDWSGGTKHLDPLTRACYLELLIFQWANDSIPSEPLLRMQLCGVTDVGTWERIWRHIGDKFEVDDDGRYRNPRMAEEREKAFSKYRRQSSGGKKSAAKRSNPPGGSISKFDNDPPGSEPQKPGFDKEPPGGSPVNNGVLKLPTKLLPKQAPSNQNQNQSIEGTFDNDPPNRITKTNTPQRALNFGKIDDKRFEDFWEVVHNRVGKRAARIAFNRVIREIAKSEGCTLNGAAEYVTERMRDFARGELDRFQRKLYPATWLNAGRYDDEQSEAPF